MKLLSVLVLAISIPLCSHTQCKGIYKALDARLIEIYHVAESASLEELQQLSQLISKEIDSLEKDLISNPIQYLDERRLVHNQRTMLKLLNRYIRKNNTEKIKFFAFHLLIENNQLRNCMGIEGYPLDALLMSIESIDKVLHVIKDPMMDLYEWFEFEQIVEDFIEQWQSYECITDEKILDCNPSLKLERHAFYKTQMESQIDLLIKVYYRDQQSDFILPTENVFNTLINIMSLYKS